MPSVLTGFEYDIFISYRHNDNRSGWVTEFVKSLQEELGATIKDSVSVYFDTNPHDGLLETHDVDDSLKEKLKCIIFIPIISQTYCDPKGFAWRNEFLVFKKLANEDQFGLKIKLQNGNTTSRILPIKIHDLDAEDKLTIENEIGGVLRAIEFIFKSAGVNRPLLAHEDHPQDNLNKTFYRDQVNKVANAIKEIISTLKNPVSQPVRKTNAEQLTTKSPRNKKSLIVVLVSVLLLGAAGYFLYPRQFPSTKVEEVALDNSIAVLPFVNMSNDPEQEYFSDGITEQIITNLAHINSLKVIARTSTMKYKKTNKSISEIGKELNVTHVLEGSIRKSGDRIRVTAQLISVKDETHLWAQDYDRGLADIFMVQDEVSMAIANSLERKLTPREYESIKSERSSNVESYQHYLKGVYIHNELYYIKRLKEDFINSENELKTAIQLDSGYALAYAALADLYDTYYNFSTTSLEERLKFEALRNQFSDTAMKLNPNNPYVISVKAYSFSHKQNKTDADVDSVFKYQRRALALAPNDVFVCDALSVDYSGQGLYYQAIQLRERTINLDPTYGNYYSLLGALYLNLGEYQKAEGSLQKAILLQQDDVSGLISWVRLKLQMGDIAEAERTIKKIKAINQESNTSWFENYLLALKGEKEKALSRSKDPRVYLTLGMKKEALDEMEKNTQHHYLQLKNSPVFNSVRDDVRFKQILGKAKIVYEERLKKYAE